MRMAFVYEEGHYGLTGKHYTNNAYRFFIKTLPKFGFDIHAISGNVEWGRFYFYDAIVIYSLVGNIRLDGIGMLPGKKIIRGPDYTDLTPRWCEAAKVFDLCINHQSPTVYTACPIPYKQIIFGIDPVIYGSTDWEGRRKDKVLLTGSMGGDDTSLRRHCINVPGVERIGLDWVNDQYGELLRRYRAGIAVQHGSILYKNFELPCTGMLTFMEQTDTVRLDLNGFIDDLNCIYINKNNAAFKVSEFIDDPDNPKWQRVAEAGRQHVLDNYTNDLQAQRLIDAIMDA